MPLIECPVFMTATIFGQDFQYVFLFHPPVKNIYSCLNQKPESIVLNLKFQKGYGVFSYSRSQLDRVYQYILNQEEHHQKKSFRKEYISFLKKFEIEYDIYKDKYWQSFERFRHKN